MLTALLALVLADVSAPGRGSEEAFGGMGLAMVRVVGWLRRLIWIDLIGGLFLPIGMANAENAPLTWLLGLTCWAIKLGAFMVVLSGIQMVLGRIPRHSLPDLIGVAALLALLAIVMVLASAGTA